MLRRSRASGAPALVPCLALVLGLFAQGRSARGGDAPTTDPVEAAIATVTDAAAARGAPGAAVVALGERAVPALRRGLAGAQPPGAEAAAILLGRLGEAARPALADLVEALEDDAEAVRAASAAAIDSIGWPDDAALDALVAKGTDPDAAVRRVAFRAAVDTGRIGAEAVAARLAEHETRRECALALRGLRGRAVETLATLLAHPSRHVRFGAAEALATSGTAAARGARALAEAARSPEPRLRDAALSALFGSGEASDGTRRVFLDLAASSDATLRAHMVLALADPMFDDPETARVLDAAAADPDEHVRLAAALGAGSRGKATHAQRVLLARAAAQAGMPIPYPVVSSGPGHRNLRTGGGRGRHLPWPRAYMAWPTLRRAPAPDVLAALREAWKAASEEGRVALLRALTSLGTEGTDDLRSHLLDPSKVVRREAALCLATFGDAGAAAVPVLVELLGEEGDPRDQPEDYYGRSDAAVVAALAARAPASLAPLVVALEAYAASPTDRVRPPPRDVFEVLEESGATAAPAAVAATRVLVETGFAYPGADADSWVVPQHVVAALRALGEPVVRALADRLLDADRDVRWRARHALRDLGKAAAPALEALDRAAASGPEAERQECASVASGIRRP